MTHNRLEDSDHEGRKKLDVDIDRMVNEGLGGGLVTPNNGLIEDTTTDTLGLVQSLLDDNSCNEEQEDQ